MAENIQSKEFEFSVTVVGFVCSRVDFGIAHNALALHALSRSLCSRFQKSLLDVSDVCRSGTTWYGCRRTQLQDRACGAPVIAGNNKKSVFIYCMPLDLFPLVLRDFTEEFCAVISKPNAHNVLYAPWELEKCGPDTHRLYRRFFSGNKTIGTNWSFCTVSMFSRTVFDTLLQQMDSKVIPISESSKGRNRCRVFAVPARDVDELCKHTAESISATGDHRPWTASFAMDFCSGFERKNPFAAIDAFILSLKATNDDDGSEPDDRRVNNSLALFSLKTSNFDKMSAAFQHYWRAQWQDRCETNASICQFDWHDGDWSRQEFKQWLAACDVYVSLHRSEGFGFTMFEAMALGKPCVATRYGGNTDFMTESNSLLVDYQMATISKRAARCYRFKGAQWANPNIEHAASALAKLRTHPTFAAEVGRRAREHVQEKWSLQARANTFEEFFLSIVDAT